MYKLSNGWLELLTREHRAVQRLLPSPPCCSAALCPGPLHSPHSSGLQMGEEKGGESGISLLAYTHTALPGVPWKNSGPKKGLMPYFDYSSESQVLVKLPGKPSPETCCTRRTDRPRSWPLAPHHSGVGWMDGCRCPWGCAPLAGPPACSGAAGMVPCLSNMTTLGSIEPLPPAAVLC